MQLAAKCTKCDRTFAGAQGAAFFVCQGCGTKRATDTNVFDDLANLNGDGMVDAFLKGAGIR